ncbi:hypothetical protein SS50377_20487 [Spironucleus salmonicida]|uniref:Uncharacterized protein n=1 Tax=Spironucleus salmonicida TaxID=348837 RepID=A0A9P8LZG6_9EUKA|nr:hypothetical protein SS50377_20487 [Spironucleus salmonicida]
MKQLAAQGSYLLLVNDQTVVLETPTLQNFVHELEFAPREFEFYFPFLKLQTDSRTVLMRLSADGSVLEKADTLDSVALSRIENGRLSEVAYQGAIASCQSPECAQLRFAGHVLCDGLKIHSGVDYIVGQYQLYFLSGRLVILRRGRQHFDMDYAAERVCLCQNGVALIGPDYIVLGEFVNKAETRIHVGRKYAQVVFTEFKIMGLGEDGFVYQITPVDQDQAFVAVEKGALDRMCYGLCADGPGQQLRAQVE